MADLIERLEALRSKIISAGWNGDCVCGASVATVEAAIVREKLLRGVEQYIAAGGRVGVVYKDKA